MARIAVLDDDPTGSQTVYGVDGGPGAGRRSLRMDGDATFY